MCISCIDEKKYVYHAFEKIIITVPLEFMDYCPQTFVKCLMLYLAMHLWNIHNFINNFVVCFEYLFDKEPYYPCAVRILGSTV